VDAAVADGRVDTEKELWEKVEARCAYLQTQPGLIRSHTLFHWWLRILEEALGAR
jgi:hypothetical protein